MAAGATPAILTQELAHIKRCDLFWQMVAVIATALWWFQPIAWLSRSALRRESERACDASALSSGLRPSEYARELLFIAQRFTQNQASPSAGIAVVRRGELEGRLYAILDEQPGQPGRPPLAAFAALFALTLVSSCLTVLPEVKQFQGGHPMKNTVLSGLLFSAGLSAATIGGSVFDPRGSAVPDAQALLLNADTSVKQEAKTTPDGKFTFEGLSAGSYILHIEKPGFSSLFREFNVQPDSEVRKGLVLSAGSPADPGPVPGSEAKPLDGNPLRVKGTLAQTNLVKKVQPAYPAEAKTQHVQGVVQLEAVISKDGVPEDLRVLSSPSDDLSQSALEAVRQWRYRPTWLNGQPVQIVTDVRINYTLAE